METSWNCRVVVKSPANDSTWRKDVVLCVCLCMSIPVSDMTYNVFSGTLNPTQSIRVRAVLTDSWQCGTSGDHGTSSRTDSVFHDSWNQVRRFLSLREWVQLMMLVKKTLNKKTSELKTYTHSVTPWWPSESLWVGENYTYPWYCIRRLVNLGNVLYFFASCNNFLLIHGQVTIVFVVSVCLSVSQPSSIWFGSN